MAFALLVTLPASAEPVSINGGEGMGYSFSYRNNCYVILPDHVRGNTARLSLRGTTSIGDATVFHTFGENPDLAVATVTSGLEGNCEDEWADFLPDVQDVLDASDTALLIRLTNSDITRDEMVVTSVGFTEITAELADPALAYPIQQGTSGSMLMAGRTIVGMATDYDDATGQATFLRMDEIVGRVGRLLNRGPGAPLPEPVQGGSAAVAAVCSPGGIVVRTVQCSIEPVSPEFGCSNLLSGSGPVIFPAGSTPHIIVELDGDEPPALGAVSLATDQADTTTTKPKGLLIEVSNARSGQRWRRFAAGDMNPVGSFLAENGARPYARHVSIAIQSAWDEALPIRLDCLAAIP